MITAAEARALSSRNRKVADLLEQYDKEIRTQAKNGNSDLKVYHDSMVRKFMMGHLLPKESEDIFREVSRKLTELGFEVKAYPNKLMISWSK